MRPFTVPAIKFEHVQFMAPVWHCDPRVGEVGGGGGTGCFAFLWSMACVLSVTVWFLFFLLPLVGYGLCHFLDILSSILHCSFLFT